MLTDTNLWNILSTRARSGEIHLISDNFINHPRPGPGGSPVRSLDHSARQYIAGWKDRKNWEDVCKRCYLPHAEKSCKSDHLHRPFARGIVIIYIFAETLETSLVFQSNCSLRPIWKRMSRTRTLLSIVILMVWRRNGERRTP